MKTHFLSKVDKTPTCWNWLGYCNPQGYGQYHIKGKPIQAHRRSYQLFVGPIPSKLLVLHKCDNPSCVNPEHLYLGTHKDNARDCTQRHRRNPKANLPRGPIQLLSPTQEEEIRSSTKSIRALTIQYHLSRKRIQRIQDNIARKPYVRLAPRKEYDIPYIRSLTGTLEEISTITNISKSVIVKIRGDLHPSRTKLSNEEAAYIRNSTEIPEYLAKKFNVSKTHVINIRQGRTRML